MSSFSTGVALCRGVMASGLPLRFRIRGTSMMPTLWSGDRVIVHRRMLADVARGEVVVFARNQYFVAHRVVRRIAVRNHVRIVTRGDAQAHDDSPFDPAEFVGVVTELERGGTRRPLDRERSIAALTVSALVRRSPKLRSLLDRLNAAWKRAQVQRSAGAPAAPLRGHA